MPRSKRTYANINRAHELLDHINQWLAFRYLFAQQFNSHHPQGGVQNSTKTRSFEVASQIVEALGGSIMAPPPPGLSSDDHWTQFIDVVTKLPRDMLPCIMRTIVDRSGQRKLADKMSRLHFMMIDMGVQQSANAGGWVVGAGWRTKNRRRRKG